MIVVVYGQPVATHVTHESIASLIVRVLHLSGNAGQPPVNWEARDEAGHILDPHVAVDFYLSDRDKVFINLRAGMGA